MDKDALIKGLRFRFTEADDVQKYGSDWHVYDELAIVRQPARVLMGLEIQMGTSVADVFKGFRRSTTLGELAAVWLALRLEGKEFAFSEFDPMIHTLAWEEIPDEELGKETRSTEPSPTQETATVSLPIMPAVG